MPTLFIEMKQGTGPADVHMNFKPNSRLESLVGLEFWYDLSAYIEVYDLWVHFFGERPFMANLPCALFVEDVAGDLSIVEENLFDETLDVEEVLSRLEAAGEAAGGVS